MEQDTRENHQKRVLASLTESNEALSKPREKSNRSQVQKHPERERSPPSGIKQTITFEEHEPMKNHSSNRIELSTLLCRKKETFNTNHQDSQVAVHHVHQHLAGV